MANLIVCNEGELVITGWALRDTSVTDDIKLKLFKNNVTPSATSTVATFTQADFTGYSAKSLARASWTAPSTVSGKAYLSYADQTWTNGGSSQTVYGYYVTTADDATLLWAERFDTPRSVTTTTMVSPKFTGASEA
ncbi:hypothetical protein [Anatilimnocola floriformis]|uniref:hypothetical protein n=1 Tax=Anatilimnocola floriformis TaxID=2948575 RepID=UPI0020C20F09|nr:hypothetical protein [Anatilimnocola floriformis]